MLTGTNNRLLTIFKMALFRNFNFNDLADNRVKLNIQDTNRFLPPSNLSAYDKYQWEKKNCYCFNVIVPENSKLNVYDELHYNLDRYFNYSSKFAKEKTKCIVITCIDSTKLKASPTIVDDRANNLWTFKNTYLKNILYDIDTKSKYPIINEIGFDRKVDIELTPNFNDIASLKKQLNKQGLDLTFVDRTIDMFVISDK